MSAKVAIAADYFPAYARIPRKAQRKADEFIRKFRHDPKQASIHYEPIGGAIDKQLRSVRVGDDYRAIVRAPERGDLFILLYIDHHDEAYRWAEGKQLQVHPSTGTLQFFDVDAVSAAATTPAHPRILAEAEQEYEERRLFSDYTDEQLFVGGVPKMLIPAVRALYSDTDLDQLVEHLPREAADLLTGLAAGYEYDAVLQSILDAAPAVSAPKTPPPPPPSTRTLRIVEAETEISAAETELTDIEIALQKQSTQAQFRLLDEDFDLDKALAYPLDAWRVYLHPSQRQIVQARTKGPLRITGGAGTGKTVVAMHRAAWLLQNVFTAPDDKILVTTFTKNLAHDIRNHLAKLLEPEDLTRVEVVNIDAWAADYLRGQGQPLRMATNKHRDEAWQTAFDLYGVDGYNLHFCKAEWDAVIQQQGITDEDTYVRAVRLHRGAALGRAERRKLWELFAEYRAGLHAAGVAETIDILRAARQRIESSRSFLPYRSVIVDETQDMSNEALRLIRALAGPERADDLLMVGDAHQRIYGRPAPLSQSGINVRGRRSRELRLNYRTTAAISRWSLQTLGPGEYDDLDGGRASRRGYVSLRRGATPVVKHFAHLAEERAFVVEQINRLLQRGTLPEEICIVARVKKLLEGSYGPALQQSGIDYEILEQNEPRKSSVRLATMHRVKGLEFPVVFVVAINDGLMPLATPDLQSDDPIIAAQAEQQERCLLYVATSRARDELFVTSYEQESPFLATLAASGPMNVGEPIGPNEAEPRVSPAISQDATITPPVTAAPDSSRGVFIDETPLREWPFPTRMANWLDRHNIRTVGQLIALDPSTLLGEKNLGRKTIAETRQLVQQKLGTPWETLRGGAGQPLEDAPAPVTSEVAALLEQPLANMGLPVRFFTWADKNGVVTLRDLVSKRPLELFQARNMGRGTVAAARHVVESQLGRRWEEVQRQLASGLAPSTETRWGELARDLPAEIATRPLSELSLPFGLRDYAQQAGLQTVEQLIHLDETALLAAPRLNHGLLAVAAQVVRHYSATVSERLRRFEQGFFSTLKEIFVDLETVPRMIVTRRAGLGSTPETLEEIGSTLGVTRERIRQIEKKTWELTQKKPGLVEFVELKCQQVAPEGAVHLDQLETVQWWQPLATDAEALDYFLDRLLDGRWRVVKIEAARYLAKVAQKDLDAARDEAHRVAKGLRYPLAHEQARQAVLANLSASLPRAVTSMIWEEIEENLATDESGGRLRVLAYGTSKFAQIVAYLERRGDPVSINELFAEVGRVGTFPDEVFMLARGFVGLERHFPDYQSWKATLVPLVIHLIQENGPERQWSCADLIPSLREEIDLPDWLEHWHLAAILRRDARLEYLGRLRVALPGVIEDSARVFVHDATEQLLKDAGGPLSWDEITRGLRKRLDVSDIALVGILNKAPFINVAPKRYGLLSRDLPGGVDAMSEALDELESVLERRERGLGSKFVHQEISKLSAIHAQWTEEMCLSVARGDPRFRLAMAGNGVGLSEWETVRIPSRLELVHDAIQKASGRVSVAAIQARVESIYGTSPTRLQIGALANRVGGRLDGDWISTIAQT